MYIEFMIREPRHVFRRDGLCIAVKSIDIYLSKQMKLYNLSALNIQFSSPMRKTICWII